MREVHKIDMNSYVQYYTLKQWKEFLIIWHTFLVKQMKKQYKCLDYRKTKQMQCLNFDCAQRCLTKLEASGKPMKMPLYPIVFGSKIV